MGITQAFRGAMGGTFADQWKDIITVNQFDEHTVVMPGILQRTNNRRGTNTESSNGVLSNGSRIYVPLNTAAFVFDQSGIEGILTEPGGYEYNNGQASIFSGGNIANSIFGQIKDRVGYGGQPVDNKHVAFVNLREIRGIKFGTKGPLMYNDLFYGTDLEILSYGTLSLKIVDPIKFVMNFVPANTSSYTFDDAKARATILSEFLQSFIQTLNSLSEKYRISQLPSRAEQIVRIIGHTSGNVGTWAERFGLEIASIAIENIEFAPESRELVKQYSSNRMNIKAYENVSQQSASIAAQQKIADGIKENGFGNGAGMILGMNMANTINPQTAAPIQNNPGMTFDEQIEAVKKLKDLLDIGILSQEEFELKKKEIMHL